MELEERTMKQLFFRVSKLVLIFVILGIPCLLSVAWGQHTDLSWNTFMGAINNDQGRATAVDGSGNVYVTGSSMATWGSPINAFTGFNDVFVAKLDTNGTLLWNTFLGGSHHDYSYGIAADGSGNVYVVGYSFISWGTPINAHAGDYDGFAAKLDTSGVLQWNTFLGSASPEFAYGVAVDGSGNVYVTGTGLATWGTPVAAYAGFNDGFAAKLNSGGTRLWHTFLGSASYDQGKAIAVDGSGNVYIAGYSKATWGSPVSAYTGNNDPYAAKLDSSGTLLWNTFMGSANNDNGEGIAVDGSGNVYVAGTSEITWGSPLNAHAGLYDAFVAKFDSNGDRQWHTFLGSDNFELCSDLVIDGSKNIYIVGRSSATWGSPDNAHAGNEDAYAAKLNSSGVLLWNTFMGSADEDWGNGIAVDMDRNVFVTGFSPDTWGSPVNPHVRDEDAFAARLTMQNPESDIKANGSDDTITITQGEPLSISVQLFSGLAVGDNADWWVLVRTPYPPPNNWYYFNMATQSWMPGRFPTHQGSIFDVGPRIVPGTSGLAAGTYTFYFGVDMVMNGVLDDTVAFYEKIIVIINP